MRSIPRMKQGRAAFELHNASVSILMSPSSYGVYTDKVIAATQIGVIESLSHPCHSQTTGPPEPLS